MTSQELFCIQKTSRIIDRLYNEYPALEQTTKRYICPSTFENFLRSTNPNLWLVEFRNAIDVINEYIEFSREDELDEYPGEDVLNDSKSCMLILANLFCPGDIQELTARAAISDNDVTPCSSMPTAVRAADIITENAELAKTSKPKRKSPAETKLKESLEILRGGQAQALFKRLHAAGYLDREFKPITGKKSDRAFMAKAIGELFNLQNWGVSFNELWHGRAHASNSTQYETRGLTAHCKTDIMSAPKNSLNRSQSAFICALAKAIEEMGADAFGPNSTRAKIILEAARNNGYSFAKR